ncbi:MmcQ/YjbR family DNA-binding protein [Dokdonella sp.]|uniref:MmcQ/YjbR family DNA-binding protein n=1 Tax=Dokdonella sp. TaxID=2291710 RepID=UPI001B2481E6|nr:MmcQ/YjbR family DNA-binding protein [Dokdonella sp.]MBO9661471.1 MmcQ/YjbR family DNA-binding protein [Dokdonella sp.]
MNVAELKKHCLRHPGAESKLSGPPSNVLVYSVGGKSFAYFKTSEPERWRFSIRVTPERFLELTDVPGIKPARYMARFRWVTIVDVRTVPQDYLIELVAWSYDKALSGLTKKQQVAIAANRSRPERRPRSPD